MDCWVGRWPRLVCSCDPRTAAEHGGMGMAAGTPTGLLEPGEDEAHTEPCQGLHAVRTQWVWPPWMAMLFFVLSVFTIGLPST